MIATPSISIEPNAPPRPTAPPAPCSLDASPPASPLDASIPRSLDAFSLSLLESLAQGADPAALAAAHNIPLVTLALWLREPHVKDTLDALHDLFALHRAAWCHQVVKDTVESLREVMQTADNLPERRRAAAHIIRALSDSNRRHQSRGLQPAQGASESPDNSEHADASPTRGHMHADPPGLPAPNHPTPPPTTPAPPSDLPSAHLPFAISPPLSPCSPDHTADLAITLLRRANPTNARTAARALEPVLDVHPATTPAEARAILNNLGQFAAALPDSEISSEPATFSSSRNAAKVYTLSPSDGSSVGVPLRFTMRLSRADTGHWCFRSIAPLDTS